ncbi:alpha/beta-hydrolase [Pilatotrama ljubarskyi]|nr:alpha/beta-hydrolase [Pilatotrama ljubarskyi]
MFRFLSTASAAWASLIVLQAAALPTHPHQARSVTQVSTSEMSSWAPYTQFARAAYCGSSKVANWACGDACNAVPGFQVSATGGDGDATQYYYVGYWPSQKAVVVAHEGTDPTAFESDLTDIDIPMTTLDSTLFPGVSSSVLVHEGFANQQAKTAAAILTATKNLISKNGATTVITVGHSLGGALAELDALFFTLNLPSSIHVKSVTYGTPRVGNPTYATLFDSKVPDFKRINNEQDPIPIVPGRFLGFQHPHGEIHILGAGNAVSCPGDDDATDSQCTISSVPNITKGNIIDHLGPYEGIYIGTIFCT